MSFLRIRRSFGYLRIEKEDQENKSEQKVQFWVHKTKGEDDHRRRQRRQECDYKQRVKEQVGYQVKTRLKRALCVRVEGITIPLFG